MRFHRFSSFSTEAMCQGCFIVALGVIYSSFNSSQKADSDIPVTGLRQGTAQPPQTSEESETSSSGGFVGGTGKSILLPNSRLITVLPPVTR